MQSSHQLFVDKLTEAYNNLKTNLDSFENVFIGDDPASKKQAANGLLASIKNVEQIVVPAQRPGWLKSLSTYTRRYVKEPNAASRKNLQNWLRTHKSEAQKHDWFGATKHAVDFAEIFKDHYVKSNVTALFDSLVTTLQAVIATGEIDSIKAKESLEKLIATIKQNAKGDMLSTVGLRDFLKTFGRKTMFEFATNLPGLKELSAAFEKTLDELDIEIAQVFSNVSNDIWENLKNNVPLLERETPIDLLQLPSPDDKSKFLTDASEGEDSGPLS